jgi:hypothetical protein
MPYDATTVSPDHDATWDRLTFLLETGFHLGGERFERAALYER